jgi:L-ribulose-5-phosphate 3-epimerase
MMKTAVNRWCFPSDLPVDDCLRLVRQAGLDGIEVNLEEEGDVSLTTSMAEARAIAGRAADLGVGLTSLSTRLYWRYPLTAADPAVAARGREIALRQLDMAVALGVDVVLLVVGLVTADEPYQAVHERGLAILAELGPEAAARGVRLGVENVGNKLHPSPLELRDFIDGANAAGGAGAVAAYFDIGNVVGLGLGWPEQWIAILGERIARVHVKDHRVTPRGIASVALLEGDVDWRRCMAALAAIGYDGYLTAEINPYPRYPLKLIADTTRALDILIGRHAGWETA